ncbi:hypothetical protein LPS67_004493 [Salmonella enterica subsp. enterica serovar Enteritidis]|nr:hypothetical protein [Salmonella enterica]EIN6984442.1 hypothetical protein [Salmonella enterica subsp. enterica serovar Enteritidis]
MLQKIISNKKIKMFAGYLCQRCHHPFPQVLPGKTVQGTLNAIMTETHKGKTEEKKILDNDYHYRLCCLSLAPGSGVSGIVWRTA